MEKIRAKDTSVTKFSKKGHSCFRKNRKVTSVLKKPLLSSKSHFCHKFSWIFSGALSTYEKDTSVTPKDSSITKKTSKSNFNYGIYVAIELVHNQLLKFPTMGSLFRLDIRNPIWYIPVPQSKSSSLQVT